MEYIDRIRQHIERDLERDSFGSYIRDLPTYLERLERAITARDERAAGDARGWVFMALEYYPSKFSGPAPEAAISIMHERLGVALKLPKPRLGNL